MAKVRQEEATGINKGWQQMEMELELNSNKKIQGLIK
jgi:hypothetical protein